VLCCVRRTMLRGAAQLPRARGRRALALIVLRHTAAGVDALGEGEVHGRQQGG
jgi:hypothetical protein